MPSSRLLQSSRRLLTNACTSILAASVHSMSLGQHGAGEIEKKHERQSAVTWFAMLSGRSMHHSLIKQLTGQYK